MTAEELVIRLLQRFKGVPAFTDEDAIELINEAMQDRGYKPSDSVSQSDIKLVILHAQVLAAWQIAFSVAHYFKFSDGEESVDKSMLADNYRILARELQRELDAEIGKRHGTNFRIMKRIDRPITVPYYKRGDNTWRR